MPILLDTPITEVHSITYNAVLFRHIEIHTDTNPDGSLKIRLMFDQVPYSTSTGDIKEDAVDRFRNLDLERLAMALPTSVGAAVGAVLAAMPQIKPYLEGLGGEENWPKVSD